GHGQRRVQRPDTKRVAAPIASSRDLTSTCSARGRPRTRSREIAPSVPELSKLSHRYGTPGMPLDDLSPRGLWRLPRNGIRFLGGFHGVLLSPPAQLFRGLVIAPVGCVRGVDVQIRSIVMVALGHCVLHIPVSVLALSSGVSHLTIPSAGQSNTVQTASCFASILAGLMDDR